MKFANSNEFIQIPDEFSPAIVEQLAFDENKNIVL